MWLWDKPKVSSHPENRVGGGAPQAVCFLVASRYHNRQVLFSVTTGQDTSYVVHHSLGFHSNPSFIAGEQLLCWWIWAWRGVETECVNALCVLVLGGVGKLLCGHVSAGRGAKLGLMTSSLWVWPTPPPHFIHTDRGILLTCHPWGRETWKCPPTKAENWEIQHKKLQYCLTYMRPIRLRLPDIISPRCHSFWESGLPQQHTHKQDWVTGLLGPLKVDKPVFSAKQTSWLACRTLGSVLAWGNISVNGFNFSCLTFEVLNQPGMTALQSISMHREQSHTHTHAYISSQPSPQMSQSLLFPWCFVLRRYPSRAASLWTPTTSSKKSERSKEGQEKTRREREKELCFPNHIPMGFQLRRWGRSKQFCLSCFCCVVLSFRGLFCFKLFFFFCWGIEGWLMQIPLSITPHSRPSLLCFGKIPPGN